MKKVLLLIGIICFNAVPALAQATDPAIEFELEKEDATLVRDLSDRILKINQDMLNNSASAFDAIFSRLDGVKVESSDFPDVWSFSFSKVVDKVLSNPVMDLIPGASFGIELLQDVYKLDQAQQEKGIRIENALATNRMKEILAQIAERRTTTFSLDRKSIEAVILAKFKQDGRPYLRNAGDGLEKMEAALQKTQGGVKIQTLIFEFKILEELINGVSTSYKNKEFMMCEAWMTGCDKSGWELSLTSPVETCPMISKAKYVFSGDMASQFTAAANAVLVPFLQVPDMQSRLYLLNLDIDFYMKIHPPGCDTDCAIMVPVTRKDGKLYISSKTGWKSCGSDGIFLMALNQQNKLRPLVTPIIERLATAKHISFDYIFYEDAKLRR